MLVDPVVFSVTFAFLLLSFSVNGDAEPGSLGSTIDTVLQVLMGVSMVMGFAGAIIGVITFVTTLDRRRQGRRGVSR